MGQSSLIYSSGGTPAQINTDLMFKVFTFSSRQEANQCQNLFNHQRQRQKSYQIQIKNIQTITSSNNYKVVIQMQFPQHSLRSILIERKRGEKHFQIETIFQILELTAEFFLGYKSYICDHIDLYTHFFPSQQGIQICHPLLLYGTCSRQNCDNEMKKQTLSKQILQVILMKKVYEVKYWQILNQIQQIYRHSTSSLLYNFAANFLRPQKTIQSILYQYLQMKKAMINNMDSKPLKKTSCFEQYFKDTPKQRNNSNKTPHTYLSIYKKQFSKSVIQQDSEPESSEQNFKEASMVNSFDLSFQNNQNIRYSPLQRQQVVIETVSSGQSQKLYPVDSQVHSQIHLSEKYCQKSIELYRVRREEAEGVYDGYQKDGVKTGKGKFFYHNKMYYDGYWIQGKKNGEGLVYYSNNQLCYSGYWKDDLQHGQGHIRNKDFVQIKGFFDYKDFRRVFQDNLWKQYRGMFREDWIDGEGTLTLANNESLKTTWNKGMAQGYGEFTNLNGQIIKGRWAQSQLQSQSKFFINPVHQIPQY